MKKIKCQPLPPNFLTTWQNRFEAIIYNCILGKTHKETKCFPHQQHSAIQQCRYSTQGTRSICRDMKMTERKMQINTVKLWRRHKNEKLSHAWVKGGVEKIRRRIAKVVKQVDGKWHLRPTKRVSCRCHCTSPLPLVLPPSASMAANAQHCGKWPKGQWKRQKYVLGQRGIEANRFWRAKMSEKRKKPKHITISDALMIVRQKMWGEKGSRKAKRKEIFIFNCHQQDGNFRSRAINVKSWSSSRRKKYCYTHIQTR